MNKTRIRALAIATLVGVGLSGCSLLGVDDGGGTEITVGLPPSAENAALYVGLEEGFFAEEGLRLKISTFASAGSSLLNPVIKGSYPIAVTDMQTMMTAFMQGAEIQLISPASSVSGTKDTDFGAVVVAADSPIVTAADLSGRFIASNSRLDTNYVIVRSVIDAAGGNSAGVEWAEIPYADASRAVADGKVEAAFLVEPYLTFAVKAGQRIVSHSYAEFDPKLNVNVYFTSKKWAKENPEMLEKFQRALNRSIEFGQQNPDKVIAFTSDFSEKNFGSPVETILPTYVSSFDRDSVAKLADAAVRYGVISESPDLGKFLP
jgi:NitT/TauT family transport system substrate-binding protein